MAQIADIKARFEAITTAITDIETFSFDVLSSINTNRTKTYPVCLLKMPESSSNPNINFDWKAYDIEFYMLDTHKQADTRTREEVWDELQTLAEQIIIELKDTTGGVYRIVDKAIKFDYGYDLFNDKLVAVKCSFGLNTFHCYTAWVSPAGDLLLIDGSDYLLIDSTDGLIIS